MAQAAESGKPEAIQEKMAMGRLEKFYKEYMLTEQEFIKDSSLTIKKYAEQVSKELGDDHYRRCLRPHRFGEWRVNKL